MEPKFTTGMPVKIKDDAVFGEVYNGFYLLENRVKKNIKYTIGQQHASLTQEAYALTESGHWVGVDALEPWSEPEQAKSEIDPQLFELVKAAMNGLLSNPEWMREYKGEKYIMESNIIASLSLKISKETLRLLREEKNK